jgi:D-xylonolactonase
MSSLKKYEIEPLVNEHCLIGENPLWHTDERRIYWEDILNGWIFRFDPVSGRHEKVYDGAVVGGFTFQEDGKLLLFREHDIALLNADGTTQVLASDVAPTSGRFNDVMADPEGRVFAGTGAGEVKLSDGLYCVEKNGGTTQLWKGTGCSNGMGFTPDLKQMYWTDSTARKIFIFDYDRATGSLENRREFYSAPGNVEIPDGMAVDAEGCVWSAQWDGYVIHRLDPAGQLMESVRFPVAQVSSATFGGEHCDELFVTTAGGSARKGEPAGEDTADGTLYRVHVGIKGKSEFRSRIQVSPAFGAN